MIKTWFKLVFWGMAKSFWTVGSIASALYAFTPSASQHPLIRVIVPLSLLVMGFFVSSCREYIVLARKLEQITGALTLTAPFTQAGEVMVPESKRHTVVVDIYLNARNQGSDGNSVRVQTCILNVASASPSYLMFIESNVGSNMAFKPSDVLRIDPRSETKPIVKAVFLLPEAPFPVPVANDRIEGSLEVIDIQDSTYQIAFSAVLMRNAPVSQAALVQG
jgi:hypothetical protein